MNAPEPKPSALDDDTARAGFLAAMQTPAPYAALHRVEGDVQLVETHVSWVFLTGAYAYKVKKPLRLNFLDYSTPARREALCREELRLNLRHAPTLYVDVVPIVGTPATPVVGGEGTAFEHALRMRQFARADELTQLLVRQAVDADEIAQFARALGEMHARAAHVDARSDFGTPEVVHRFAFDNFAEIRNALPERAQELRLDALQAHMQSTFDRLRDLIEKRRAAGFVRECHGDLHCGNATRWEGRLVAFDGLEFDPALRFIDVANDLAFLSMDLAARGRPDLRHALLDAWCEESGDYAAMELLPWYEGYRALVRAKVAALRARQAQPKAEEAIALVDRYLGWLRGRIDRPRPRLVVMAGLSGSGKSWLARRIARECHALRLRSDVERKRLAGLRAHQNSQSPVDGGLYTREFGERTYARLRECAAACLRGGMSVVVDAANLRRDERESFRAIAEATGARHTLVVCEAPLDVLKERIAQRRAHETDASEATVALLDRQPAWWEPLTSQEQSSALRVDTREDRAVEHALAALRD